jgi:cytochrome c biogenesis factor
LNFFLLASNFKNISFIFLLKLIFIIKINFNKKINEMFLNNNFYNNSFWDYILILNNNNKSLIFFLFVILIFFLKIKNKKNIFIIFFFIFLLQIYNIKIPFNSISEILFKYNNININLTNGLILVHPICMYISYILLIIFFKNVKIKKINRIIFYVKSKNYIFISFVSIFLGSYWSQQELNWGGWWNWDFVEIIALIFFLLYSFLIHINLNKNLNLLFSVYTKTINYLILFFFIIRLDFINSIHSFNSFNKTNFNINILLYIYITFVIIIFILYKNNYNKCYIIKINNVKNINVATLMFLTLLILFILYTYLNIFISFFYDIQYIELTKNLKFLINLSFYLISLYLIKKRLIFILIFFLSNTMILLVTILIIIIKNINNYKYNHKNIYHIFMIIFIIINIFYYNYQYYLINLNLLKTNLSLLNNLNILDDFKNHLICLNYYNNNNCLVLNNYYCYNNNILFNSVFKETLLNNILLFNKNCFILYNIDNKNIIYNFNYLYIFLIYTFFLYIRYTKKKYKLKIV